MFGTPVITNPAIKIFSGTAAFVFIFCILETNIDRHNSNDANFTDTGNRGGYGYDGDIQKSHSVSRMTVAWHCF